MGHACRKNKARTYCLPKQEETVMFAIARDAAALIAIGGIGFWSAAAHAVV